MLVGSERRSNQSQTDAFVAVLVCRGARRRWEYRCRSTLRCTVTASTAWSGRSPVAAWLSTASAGPSISSACSNAAWATIWRHPRRVRKIRAGRTAEDLG